MKKLWFIVMVSMLASTIFLNGCRSRGAQLKPPAQIHIQKSIAEEKIAVAIKAGMQKREWQVQSERPGYILATLHIRSHVVELDINYTSQQIDIKYRTSSNLRYSEKNGVKTIHRNYNKWFSNLDKDIRNEIAILESRTAADVTSKEPLSVKDARDLLARNIRWTIDSDPQGAVINFMINSTTSEVSSTPAKYLARTPYTGVKRMDIKGLTHENMKFITIKVEISKRGYHTQIKELQLSSVLQDTEVSLYSELTEK